MTTTTRIEDGIDGVRARVSGPCAAETIVRVARAAHRCRGRRYHHGCAIEGSGCQAQIAAGAVYVEHGAVHGRAGARYHVECAVHEGLVSPLGHNDVSLETRPTADDAETT